jgi:hypothetical protein
MSIATQWMNLSAKQDDLAAQVRKLYRNADKARLALMPEFAKAYGEELSYKIDGSIKGWAEEKAAKSSLNRLLALAFKGKKAKASASSSDPMELLVAYITKGEYTKAQALRAVEAAFKK